MDQEIVGGLHKLQKLNNSEFDTIPTGIRFETWSDYIFLIRDLCTALDLFNVDTFDAGHPMFMALWRTRAGMSKADCQFVENVIGFYGDALQSREEGMR